MRKVIIVLGIIIFLGGFFLLFHPATSFTLSPTTWGIGIPYLVLGELLTLWGLPSTPRFKVLGPFLAFCGIGFAFGFSFNWFYDWLASSLWVVVALRFTVAGGFLIGRSFTVWERWLAVLLALIACFGLFALAGFTFLVGPGHDLYGDFLIEAFITLFLQFIIFLTLFGSFSIGLMTKKEASFETEQKGGSDDPPFCFKPPPLKKGKTAGKVNFPLLIPKSFLSFLKSVLAKRFISGIDFKEGAAA